MSNLNNIELQEQLSNDLERMELQFGHVLGKSALFGLVALPMIPGLLTMISIGVNFPDMLHIPQWVAWLFGGFAMIGIEVLGLFSIRLALRMRKYNQKARTKELDLAPIGQGYGAAAAYLLTVMVITVLLKIFPDLAVWSLIPLSLMGALADWVFALNGDHNERESVLRKMAIDEQKRAEGEDRIAQLTDQVALVSGQLESAQAAHATAQAEIARLTSEVTQLTSKLNSTDQSTVQFAGQSPVVVYKNGDIVHGTEHLDTGDQIRAIAQRMVDSGQKLNKSKIAALVNCSRTTVQSALSD